MSTKMCRTCGEVRELERFYLARPNYPLLDCKDCIAKNQRQRRKGQSRTEESAKYRAAHLEAVKAKNRAHFHANKMRYEDNNLRRTYGITLEEKNRMLAVQNGLCAVCKKPGKLVVDHNHRTGKVRGLLHNTCNTALGMLKDDPEVAISAASYLAMDGI